MPHTPIETPNLLLCLIERSAATSKLMTPEVSCLVVTWPVPFTQEMASTRIAQTLERVRQGDALAYAVSRKTNGAMMGWITVIRDKEDAARAAMSYWLGTPYHGQGYMKEAATSLMQTAFSHLGVRETGERLLFVPSRNRQELCVFYELQANSPDT